MKLLSLQGLLQVPRGLIFIYLFFFTPLTSLLALGVLFLCHLQDADQREEVSKGEKEDILAKLSQAEKTLAEWKIRVNKLEEDNAKLRRAVEQSMTRLNRMSVDSDYLVDRLAGFNFQL